RTMAGTDPSQPLDDATVVKLWDPLTGQERASLRDHAHRVSAVAFAPDNLSLATADEGGVINLWSAVSYTGLGSGAFAPSPSDAAGDATEVDRGSRRGSEGPAGLLLELGVVVVVLLPILYLSTLCHEAGHALLGWCVGYVVLSFGLGLGRPFLVLGLGGT